MLPAARLSGSRQRSGGWAGMTVDMDFGCELRALLEERGLSLREAARLVPCDAGYLSRLAHGARRPSAAMAARLDQVLGAGGRLTGCAGREPDEAELDEMRRRELLGIFTMAGAALASGTSIDPDRVGSVAGRARVVDAEVLDELAALNAHLWRVFALARSKMLVFPLVREQLDVLLGCLARPQDSAVYERLCCAAWLVMCSSWLARSCSTPISTPTRRTATRWPLRRARRLTQRICGRAPWSGMRSSACTSADSRLRLRCWTWPPGWRGAGTVRCRHGTGSRPCKPRRMQAWARWMGADGLSMPPRRCRAWAATCITAAGCGSTARGWRNSAEPVTRR